MTERQRVFLTLATGDATEGELTTRLLAFENRVFLALLDESPALTRKLLATMSRRLHALLREIEELTLLDEPGLRAELER